MSAPGAAVVEVGEALPKVERAPLLGGGMLSGGSAGETMQTAADGVNPLPLAAQLSRLEEAHRGGYSAAELESASASSSAAPPPPGVAAAGASATAPSSLLPPRARGALLESALAAVADEGFDDGTPRGRRACTASCLAPCATLNGNVATLYSCGGGREPPRVWPWLCQWGPDWPCNIGTFALILCPTIAFQALVAWRISVGVTIAGLAVALFALVTLALTALSDPGYLPKQSKAQLEAQRRAMEEQGLSGTFTCCRA